MIMRIALSTRRGSTLQWHIITTIDSVGIRIRARSNPQALTASRLRYRNPIRLLPGARGTHATHVKAARLKVLHRMRICASSRISAPNDVLHRACEREGTSDDMWRQLSKRSSFLGDDHCISSRQGRRRDCAARVVNRSDSHDGRPTERTTQYTLKSQFVAARNWSRIPEARAAGL